MPGHAETPWVPAARRAGRAARASAALHPRSPRAVVTLAGGADYAAQQSDPKFGRSCSTHARLRTVHLDNKGNGKARNRVPPAPVPDRDHVVVSTE